MDFPRILISAPGSGSGKTLITISLIKALSMAGRKVSAFKCGPDYIDPMFHKKILGVPSRNLDLFFTDEEVTKSIFCGAASGDISIIEGVMGFYDGLSGISEEASTSHVARVLKAPVILVVDTKGMARSVLAEIAGFLSMDSEKSIKAVILNNTSKAMFQCLKPEIESRFGITVAGYFPKQKEIQLESRYLGLKLPEEIQNIQEMAQKAAEELSKTVNLDAVMELALSSPPLEFNPQLAPWLFETKPAATNKVKIAVAKDGAFCFYYEDNLKLLEYYGAELVEFSPLKDEAVPSGVNGIILGGGYPELFAEQLEKNTAMKESVLAAVKNGIPVLAECGGFMYLHDELIDQHGKIYKMAGVIDGSVKDAGKLVRFGYINVTEKRARSFFNGKTVKGHEFHYFDSTENGSDCQAVKPVTEKSWDCIHASQNGWMGFPHLYYASCPEFAENFVEACRKYEAKE